MASSLYVTGLKEILDGTIDIDNDTLKVMLVDDNYTFNCDHDVVDPGSNGAADASHNEIVATNYTGGHAGAGRKTATVTVTANKTDDRVDIKIDDLTWTSLGGGANDTIAGAILFKEGANDAASRLLAYFDVTNTVTNGGDITLNFDATSNIRVPVA